MSLNIEMLQTLICVYLQIPYFIPKMQKYILFKIIQSSNLALFIIIFPSHHIQGENCILRSYRVSKLKIGPSGFTTMVSSKKGKLYCENFAFFLKKLISAKILLFSFCSLAKNAKICDKKLGKLFAKFSSNIFLSKGTEIIKYYKGRESDCNENV